MDEQLARLFIGNAARAARALGELAPLLREHADPPAQDELEAGIGTAIYDIYEGVLNPVFRRFPFLKQEFEDSVERYGSGC